MAQKLSIFHEVLFRIIKCFDIGFVTVIYFFLGIFFAKVFDNYYGEFNKEVEEKKSMFQHTYELIAIMWISGVFIYFIRNFAELIPSPLDHIDSFEHLRVKELKNAAVFTFIFFFFQSYFKSKIQHYYNRFEL